MYLRLVWDTCKIHAKCQDTCILLECNRAFKIHLRYIRIHSRYVYPTGYMQDTCRIHQNTSRYVSDRKLHPKTIGNPPAPSATLMLAMLLLWSRGTLSCSEPCTHDLEAWRAHKLEQLKYAQTRATDLQSSPPLRKRRIEKLRQAKVPWGSKKPAHG